VSSSTVEPRRSAGAAVGAIVLYWAALGPTPAPAGPVQWVDMAGVRLTPTPELRPSYSTDDPPRGLLGSDTSGAVFAGCSDTGWDARNPRVWRLGRYVPDDQRVWVNTNAVLALTRRAADLWVLGRPGLFRMHAGELERVGGVRATNAPSPVGVSMGEPPPRLIPAEGISGAALAVDSDGVAWALGTGGSGVRAYIPPLREPPTVDRSWYTAHFHPPDGGRSALAADPSMGVWLYTPSTRDPGDSLLHLRVEGTPPDARIVVADDSPRFEAMPSLVHPHMTVGLDHRALIAGQTLAGDLLVEIAGAAVSSQTIPPALTHARRVTAVEADRQGCVYLATDGAGVLTYREGEWGVHPITEHLPVLEGSDLKPVDDILVTEDGTLYAACQFQVVIWTPDQP